MQAFLPSALSFSQNKGKGEGGGGGPVDPPLFSRKKHEFSSVGRLSRLQLDPTNSNSVISNSPLFRIHNNFPWICPSVIYYRLLRAPAISNYFLFPLELEIAGFNCKLAGKSRIKSIQCILGVSLHCLLLFSADYIISFCSTIRKMKAKKHHSRFSLIMWPHCNILGKWFKAEFWLFTDNIFVYRPWLWMSSLSYSCQSFGCCPH